VSYAGQIHLKLFRLLRGVRLGQIKLQVPRGDGRGKRRQALGGIESILPSFESLGWGFTRGVIFKICGLLTRRLGSDAGVESAASQRSRAGLRTLHAAIRRVSECYGIHAFIELEWLWLVQRN